MSLISIRGSLCTGDSLRARGASASREGLQAAAPSAASCLGWRVGSYQEKCRLTPTPRLSTGETREMRGEAPCGKYIALELDRIGAHSSAILD